MTLCCIQGSCDVLIIGPLIDNKVIKESNFRTDLRKLPSALHGSHKLTYISNRSVCSSTRTTSHRDTAHCTLTFLGKLAMTCEEHVVPEKFV